MTTSTVELSNVSPHGLWLLVDERELYLPFDAFPWVRDATFAQLARIERPARGPLTREAIDNCSHRRLVLSTDQILRIMLGLLAGLAE